MASERAFSCGMKAEDLVVVVFAFVALAILGLDRGQLVRESRESTLSLLYLTASKGDSSS